jgi:hypothetical protein
MLYIRSSRDLPHRMSNLPEFARCGALLTRARPITEAQARVFLGDARCPSCFPYGGRS